MTAVEMADAIVSKDDWPNRASESRSPPTLFLLPGSIGYGPSMAAFATAIRGRSGHPYQIPGSQKHPRRKEYGCQHGRRRRRADPAEPICRRYSPSRPFARWAVRFEVAARLLEAGRVVKFLGILDTSIVNERRDYRETFARVVRRVRTNRINVSRVACRALAKVTCAIGCEARLAWILDRYSRRKFDATCFRIKLELQEVLRSRAFFQWLASPKPAVPINATLFRCDQREYRNRSAGIAASQAWT